MKTTNLQIFNQTALQGQEILTTTVFGFCNFRTQDDWEEDEPEIDSVLRDDLEGDASEREGKFMIYWTTIVTTSWTTKYTSTSSLATIMCTPSGFTLFSACGKKKK